MTAPREILTFMSIPAALLNSGSQQLSFEEVRIADYLHHYQTTGSLPPPPCPEQPTLPQDRIARGLPPLFEPVIIPSVPPVSEKDLPEWQEFSGSVEVEGTKDNLQSVSATEQYAGFSFEELRYYAYLSGRIHPPPHIKLVHPTTTTTTATTTNSLFASSSSTALTPSTSTGGGSGLTPLTTETLLSISSKPEFAAHSFEELRIASTLAHPSRSRDVPSSEIMGIAPPPPSSQLPHAPSLFSSTPSSSSSYPPSAPTSTASPFSFNGAPGGGGGGGGAAAGGGGAFSFSPAIRF